MQRMTTHTPVMWRIGKEIVHLFSLERMLQPWMEAIAARLKMIHWLKRPRRWMAGPVDTIPTLRTLRAEVRRARCHCVQTSRSWWIFVIENQSAVMQGDVQRRIAECSHPSDR